MTRTRINKNGSGSHAPEATLVSPSHTNRAHSHSVLFPASHEFATQLSSEAPACFHDLNLDQIVAAIISLCPEYNLAPYYYTHLNDPAMIIYRQEVMQDLESPALMATIEAFSKRMQAMRALSPLAEKHYCRYERERWFLDAVDAYREAVEKLCGDLGALDLTSRGMQTFRTALIEYVASDHFRKLVAESVKLKSEFGAIRYCLRIDDGSVTVRPYEAESDYSAAIEAAFSKFRLGAAQDYRVQDLGPIGMNHIQDQVVERVALLFPEAFRALERFYTEHADYLDGLIANFDCEIQFYVVYLTYIGTLRIAGLSFCYPQIKQNKEISSNASFDLGLAARLTAKQSTVVTNDFFLHEPERMLVVSGPNQSGKTTFARMFGQLHWLACLGCPVPGTAAQLLLFDQLFTHFEREEDIRTLRGKLQDDLVRVRQILDQATPNSIVILNEIFSSTTLKDAVSLGKRVLDKLTTLDLLGICVTFLDELPELNEKTVSVVGNFDPEHPEVRTYKLERKPPDGLSHALAIAEKHRVTYDWLTRRINA